MGYKVAIDAGHGSNTAGKRHPDGYREHYSNVQMAYYLEQILSKNGIQTLKVSWNDANSKDDADVALTTRQKQIKSFGADISVSIHANAYGDGKSYNSAAGVVTYYHKTASYAKDSAKLASLVQKEMIKGTKQLDRGTRTDAFAMCNCSAMGTKASVLVETAFMTNSKEAELLKSDSFCRECAKEMAQGIFNYLGVSGNVNIPLVGVDGKSDAQPNSVFNTSSNYVFGGYDYSLVFDPTYYVNKYPDLKAALGMDAKKLFDHFCTFGMKEGRQANATFNVTAYKNNYADLQKAYGTNLPEYYKHYVVFGYKEKRKAL